MIKDKSMVIDGEKYITEKEVSSQYGLSLGWIRKRRYADEMPYHKLKSMVFFKPKEVDEWLKETIQPVNTIKPK